MSPRPTHSTLNLNRVKAAGLSLPSMDDALAAYLGRSAPSNLS